MPLQIPHPNTPLHLYRHLLREASYLPPLCQPWITSRIQARFRDCRHTKRDPTPYIKDAHHQLRYLRSANSGHVERIVHLCFLATGRVGKRRRLLATAELARRAPADSAELESKINLDTSSSDAKDDCPHREPDWLDNWSTDMIKALALSQVDKQSSNSPQHMRRVIDPKRTIPTENCFGRPLNDKLKRNKLKRHWVTVLRQILPPLPRGEWDRLGALARGEADADELRMPARRPVAQSVSNNTDSTSWDWTKYVTRPVRSVERGASRKMKSLTGLEDEDPRGHGRAIGTRVLGNRRLRRSVYSRVWEASPILEKNPRSGKSAVTWGGVGERLSRPSAKELQLFQGVEEDGTVAHTTTEANTG